MFNTSCLCGLPFSPGRNSLTLSPSVGIASIFQIIQARQYHPATNELPFQLALAMVWGSVEVFMAVFISNKSSYKKSVEPLFFADQISRFSGTASAHLPKIYPRTFLWKYLCYKPPQQCFSAFAEFRAAKQKPKSGRRGS